MIFASSCYIFLLHGVNGKVSRLLLSVTYLLEKSAFITVEGFMDKQFLANHQSHSFFNLLKKNIPCLSVWKYFGDRKDDVERKTALLVKIPVFFHNATYIAEEEHISVRFFQYCAALV